MQGYRQFAPTKRCKTIENAKKDISNKVEEKPSIEVNNNNIKTKIIKEANKKKLDNKP